MPALLKAQRMSPQAPWHAAALDQTPILELVYQDVDVVVRDGRFSAQGPLADAGCVPQRLEDGDGRRSSRRPRSPGETIDLVV